MYNGLKLLTCPSLARIKAGKAKHITKYKIRPLNTSGREIETATLIRKQVVLYSGSAT